MADQLAALFGNSSVTLVPQSTGIKSKKTTRIKASNTDFTEGHPSE